MKKGRVRLKPHVPTEDPKNTSAGQHVQMSDTAIQRQKKRHHYIPITYLKRFTNQQGRIVTYQKDEPDKVLCVAPKNIAFEKYYYSQPLPEGGYDNNRLENLFSIFESDWPGVVEALERGCETPQHLDALFNFLGLLRSRTPAARDAYEHHLAHTVKRTAQLMNQRGQLPAPPEGLADLLDHLDVAVDPHMSLHAMPMMMQSLAMVFERTGFEVVHNETPDDFVTSDNPVAYFDPDHAENVMRPYDLQRDGGRVEFLCPITPRLLIRGRSELPILRSGMHIRHVRATSGSEVRRVNRITARFAYRFVFARNTGLEDFVKRYAALSPTIEFETAEDIKKAIPNIRMAFAPRKTKLSWPRES